MLFTDTEIGLPETPTLLPHRTAQWPQISANLEKIRRGGGDDPGGFCDIMIQMGTVSSQKQMAGFSKFFESSIAETSRVLRFCGEAALALPELYPGDKTPLRLIQGIGGASIVSEWQAVTLLACGFLGIIPVQPHSDKLREEGRMSFSYWWIDQGEIEKLKCLFQYFKCAQIAWQQRYRRPHSSSPSPGQFQQSQDAQSIEEGPNVRRISFMRKHRCPRPVEEWYMSSKPLGAFDVVTAPASVSEGRLEDSPRGSLLVDFANRSIGGGVLRGGKAQEEIMFVTYPELILIILIAETLKDDEVVEVEGFARFASYEGYGRAFTFSGPCSEGRSGRGGASGQPRMVAMDAVAWPMDRQYTDELIARELNKALTGFSPPISPTLISGEEAGRTTPTANRTPVIATGNWGCGVFGGDAQLKALIQWAAASESQGSPLVVYYTDQSPLLEKLPQVVGVCRAQGRSVGW
eukprot:CAMPEP_0185795330 /NCGR_PEP_ID=MMETSP1174-20130828/160493_1 /TAXON_ID=35687 /ORGANISM="Dictyocha speculum, Strain CCMP1381" /LENGTH=462 /DNA_ID=CAMNT_0028490621 /DNA_START=963 /DNA_END=2348 /DNA_ORIENTATION=+